VVVVVVVVEVVVVVVCYFQFVFRRPILPEKLLQVRPELSTFPVQDFLQAGALHVTRQTVSRHLRLTRKAAR